jgi:hypothetical protein
MIRLETPEGRDEQMTAPTRTPSRVMPPRIATIEVTEDTPILVLPLAERQRLFRRRRQLVHLREWFAAAGIGVFGLIVACIALVSFLAR